MNIFVTNRSVIVNKLLEDWISDPFFLISIETEYMVYDKQVENVKGCVKLLKLKFNDVCSNDPEILKQTPPITNEQINEILTFVFDCMNYDETVKQIVVHCDAGVSRSAGVAMALSIILNGEEFMKNLKTNISGNFDFHNVNIKNSILRFYESEFCR